MKENFKAPQSLCAVDSWMTGEFPAQKASNVEKFPFDDVMMSSADRLCSNYIWVIYNFITY